MYNDNGGTGAMANSQNPIQLAICSISKKYAIVRNGKVEETRC